MITGKAWFFRDKLGQLFMSTLEPVKNDDITMPEELRGKFFTKEDLEIRRKWVTEIVQKCLDFLYEY